MRSVSQYLASKFHAVSDLHNHDVTSRGLQELDFFFFSLANLFLASPSECALAVTRNAFGRRF